MREIDEVYVKSRAADQVGIMFRKLHRRRRHLPELRKEESGKVRCQRADRVGIRFQGLRTTSLPLSSTRMAAGETLTDPNREELDCENDRTLRDQRKIPENPWNAFQQANRGRGWSQKKMQEEYWSQKGRGKGYKSGKP